jgi:type IV pilus assembly protein PilY1
VKGSPWEYSDDGYNAFKAQIADRAGMIYVGANDGMLHAFYADGADAVRGQEAWAYVPNFIYPTLYKLADKYYSSKHEYYVDGTPVRGDVCPSSPCSADQWKTILVGGVNRGGRGYYALDVTKPDEPKALWEFSSKNSPNLGYTYGNPVITKLTDGTWVVMFTSGYNNGSSATPPGDGGGWLYVLDAYTGVPIGDPIPTLAGSADSPSGLAKISGYASFPNDNNTSLRVYGGDLLGNVWRFDINGLYLPDGIEAHKLATLEDSLGNAQPITTRPELGIVEDTPVVFVGTGQLLGLSDLAETDRIQSLYGIKDKLDDTSYGSPRNMPPTHVTNFIEQSMTDDAFGDTELREVLDKDGKPIKDKDGNVIKEEVDVGDGEADECPEGDIYCPEGRPMISVTKRAVDWTKNDGWYVDFLYGGERINTDVHLDQGTLVFVTNQPQTGACVPAGKSRVYFLDYRTGGVVGECDGEYCMAGWQLDDNLASSVTVIGGNGFAQCDGGDCAPFEIPHDYIEAPGQRISWRELIIE